ncbi:glutathione S-transferase family protein [Henriciella marina]|uniref:Glutathione S-transferase family protein n=1 Tax=Henriciella marina TaxID=453851 RepID=A0ABT4LSH0_9PROT|nr:glutathione S-transferase family protein [Henriciella marina]MCZ4297306.1 glutathione S-transferase family protein [Henriciella marina]
MKPTLYHCRNARSFRPLWALEEMGIDYDLVVLPFPPRVHYKQYLEINPLGTIPFFTDGKTKMTESTGICHYLAETHGPTDLAVRPDEGGYGHYLNWMYFSDATLTFPQTLVLRYEMLEKKPRRQPQVADDYRMWFSGRLRIVDQKLEHSRFMVADRFTMADIAIGYGLLLASVLPPLEPCLTATCKEYLGRMKERPAFKRAQERQKQALVVEVEGDSPI